MSLIDALKTSAKRLGGSQAHLQGLLNFSLRPQGSKRRLRNRDSHIPACLEALETRALMTAIAIADGGWTDPNTWENGVLPTESMRAIIGHGVTVELDGADHIAQELVIHGDLVVLEDTTDPDKSLTTRWIHVNSGGEFVVGSAGDRYDEGTFTLNLTGTDVYSDHVIETNMMGTNPGTMNVSDNDGFLMTAMEGRIQFYGEDKLSFTKLAKTAEDGDSTIIVENIIERNYDKGGMLGNDFVTSAADDGAVNWEIGDQIVIASSSYDYTEEDVRTITAIAENVDGTRTILTLNEPLTNRHYGEIETYGETTAEGTTAASQAYEIDMRAEVALLSRNVKIQGVASQDTDGMFGDRANVIVEDRIRSTGLSPHEAVSPTQVANGVGAHIMIMPDAGQVVVDGVQMEGMGQSSQKGRYPIHWHLGGDRTGDVLKNSSITNSNNRGVTIHGTNNLQIEGVVLHDIHGHGFFFEDAVETGNELVANIAFGIHTVGGKDFGFNQPGLVDEFVVDTHDNVTETRSRFKSSAAFWITNPSNTFVGNIAAGAGDSRVVNYTDNGPGPAGTGFWFAIPRTGLGKGGAANPNYRPIFAEFGQFDNNSSHSTAVGLNFDRGNDLEDAKIDSDTFDFGAVQQANEYKPLDAEGNATTNFINGFTNYKSIDAGVYHRGQSESINFNDLRIADSYNAVWSVSENTYNNSLFVGHSQGNADDTAEVGGPRLYDGAGLYATSHFAGFADPDAYAFQVEGSSFGPTMYHAFTGTSFENDGTYDHIAHAVSDSVEDRTAGHDLGQPHQWIKAALDIDGTLTSGVGGGAGYSIVPNIDFLVEDDDVQPDGWDAYLTDDVYARVRILNNDDGEALFPSNSDAPLVRFTARDGDSIEVTGGQNINETLYWTQIAAKADSEGEVEGTLTVEFLKNGLPPNGFVLNMKNQDGGRSDLNPAIQAKVDAARIVTKFVAAGNFTPTINGQAATEVSTETELRSATGDVVFFRDATGNLLLNTGIVDSQPNIKLTPGAKVQTAFESRTVQFGTTIEAEHFDNGPDTIAYHDSDATNSLGTFRGTGVDTTEDAVGDIVDGEWLEYTTDIVANVYRVGLNVSSTQAGGQIRVLAATNNSAALTELATVTVPDTGGEFSTEWINGIDLAFAAGEDSVIRLEFLDGGFEVDSMQFARVAQTAYVENRIITAALNTSTRIELEEYDKGGEGIAYHDNTPTNDAINENNDFRPDEGVDASNTLVTNTIEDGEWLEYTTDIQAGVYDITLRKAWGGDSQSVKLFIGESNAATEFTELGEFKFVVGGGESIKLENIDLSPWAGSDRVIRIEMVESFYGLDWIDFAPAPTDVVDPVADIVDVTPDPRNTNAGVVTINFDEDVSGVDINDLTLTRDGNTVDINGLTLTQVSPGEYTIDLSTVTAANGQYELKLNSSGSGIQDLAGNLLANDAVDQFQVDMTGAQVESVVINDGSAQRSMVSEITVTFSEAVNGVDASSFILTNTTTNVQIVPTVATQVLNGKTIAKLTFSGSGIIGGSLADGNYSLTTLALPVTDAVGNQLDGNGDGTNGDDATVSFFRLFGDGNGDQSVNIYDFFGFLKALRGRNTAAFDFNGDGNVNIFDFFRFRSQFGKTL